MCQAIYAKNLAVMEIECRLRWRPPGRDDPGENRACAERNSRGEKQVRGGRKPGSVRGQEGAARQPFLYDARRRAPQATLTRGPRGGPPLTRFVAPRDRPPIRSCSGWGLPCRTGRPVRGELLPRRFTLTARCNSGRRCAFCGAVLGVAPTGDYPAPCPAEPGLSSRPFRGRRPPSLLGPSCNDRRSRGWREGPPKRSPRAQHALYAPRESAANARGLRDTAVSGAPP